MRKELAIIVFYSKQALAAAVIILMLIAFPGVKFIVRPVMTTKETMTAASAKKRFIQSVICGILIGFVCGFMGAGGGMPDICNLRYSTA